MKKPDVKTLADRYAKIVEWSAEDVCYIGRVPALGYGGVHGKDRAKVFEEICRVAEEIVAIHLADGRKLPSPATKKYSGKFLLRIPAGLHEALAIEAEKNGMSLNALAAEALRSGLQPA
jgi:predicted HicB family RNase H-like nuclease